MARDHYEENARATNGEKRGKHGQCETCLHLRTPHHACPLLNGIRAVLRAAPRRRVHVSAVPRCPHHRPVAWALSAGGRTLATHKSWVGFTFAHLGPGEARWITVIAAVGGGGGRRHGMLRRAMGSAAAVAAVVLAERRVKVAHLPEAQLGAEGGGELNWG